MSPNILSRAEAIAPTLKNTMRQGRAFPPVLGQCMSMSSEAKDLADINTVIDKIIGLDIGNGGFISSENHTITPWRVDNHNPLIVNVGDLILHPNDKSVFMYIGREQMRVTNSRFSPNENEITFWLFIGAIK